MTISESSEKRQGQIYSSRTQKIANDPKKLGRYTRMVVAGVLHGGGGCRNGVVGLRETRGGTFHFQYDNEVKYEGVGVCGLIF